MPTHPFTAIFNLLKLFISRFLGVNLMGNKLDNIYHYLKLSESVATSGQPTEEQFSEIKEAGYQVVVNLALPTSVNAIPEESAIVENLGMQYIHIPVVWENPTIENFQDFTNAMESNGDRSVFVHCAANMRVSAFMYLYNRIFKHLSYEQAEENLHQIWTPNQTWQEFIENTIKHYQGSSKPSD
jgi:protein tyrosine phosphatase (PTP) superfamily phosphohydrolase (DUF442 family)